ncbi:hypothetical protein TNCV_4455471 [Trichonephila clavipes]|nr:hypothetical protein TNCV_4455471 [Trichonephila clavipes]
MVIDGVASGVKRLSGGVTSSRRGESRRILPEEIRDNGLDSKKAKTSDIIETQNQFSGLLNNNEDTMDVVDPQEGTSSATSHPGVTAPQKKPHVPPINIDNVQNQAALLQHLQNHH